MTNYERFKGVKQVKYPSDNMTLRFGSKDRMGEIVLVNSTGKFKFNPPLDISIDGTDLSVQYGTDKITLESSTGNSTDIISATADTAGILTSTDKSKLDDIEEGAQVNTVTSVNTLTGAVSLGADSVGAEPTLSNPSTDGHILSSTVEGVRSWVAQSTGVTSFIGLSDTPNTFAANQYTAVNSAGDALVFVNPPSGVTDISITQTASDEVTVNSSTGAGDTILEVSTTVAGVMGATDKVKLNGIEEGAQVNTVTSVNDSTGAVSLDAGDVSARPDSWMPSAADVGADAAGSASAVQDNLNTHIDTQSGNPHDVSLADIGAAAASHTHPGDEITSAVDSAGNADTVDSYHISVVTALPATPDADTLYFITG